MPSPKGLLAAAKPVELLQEAAHVAVIAFGLAGHERHWGGVLLPRQLIV